MTSGLERRMQDEDAEYSKEHVPRSGEDGREGSESW